jgi:hypothetical protein
MYRKVNFVHETFQQISISTMADFISALKFAEKQVQTFNTILANRSFLQLKIMHIEKLPKDICERACAGAFTLS